MTTKKKLSLISVIAIACAFAVIISLVTISFRNLGAQSAKQKAAIAAELVKDGLTAHMVNGIMNNREFFLNKIENAENISELWVSRAPSVIEQFGKGFNNEVPRDDIDKEVIATGKTITHLDESSGVATLRFTVPYKATNAGGLDCMNCHNAQEGDTLGTVSMVIDVTQSRSQGVWAIVYIIAISLILMVLVLWIFSYSLSPFMKLFDSIEEVMKNAKDGDYTKRINDKDLQRESQNVSQWINGLLDKLEQTLNDIHETSKDFFTKHQTSKNNDPLIEIKEIVSQMADIYRFKKTVEFDETKEDVYRRLIIIIKKRILLDNFELFEVDNNNGSVKLIYPENSKTPVHSATCRAIRTKQGVYSDQFENICATCPNDKDHFICMPYIISDDFEIVLRFNGKDKKAIDIIRDKLQEIDNYIDAVRPELVNKNLNAILKRSATTDQLTKLYNRKFLDDFIEKSTAQALRTESKYTILMLDIDFFKAVNDTYGHDVGDKVIKKLAEVISSCIRKADIAFRYGGEEFLIMLYNCNQQKSLEIAEKIRTTFAKQTTKTNEKSFSKTLSIGVSFFPEDADSIWRCIKFADLALYQAKNTGRDKVITFDESLLGNGDLKNTYSTKG